MLTVLPKLYSAAKNANPTETGRKLHALPPSEDEDEDGVGVEV